MNKKIGLILVLLCLVIISGGCFNKKSTKTTKENVIDKDYGELVEITYSDSGDMNGNIDALTIDVKESTMKKEFSRGIDEAIEVTVYNIERDEVENLIDMIKENDLPALDDLPLDEEMMPLDAATPVLTFEYDTKSGKKEWYSINFYTKIPEKKMKVLKEFTKKMRDFEENGVVVNKYKEDRNW